MARLLFCVSPIYGHIEPLRLIAAQLVARGHDVTIITDASFEEAVAGAGARLVPTHGAAAYTMGALAAEQAAVAEGLDTMNWQMTRLFIDPVPVLHELIQAELAAAGDEPVVLVTDEANFGGWPALLGAPGLRPAGTIGIGMTILFSTSVDVPPLGSGLMPDATPAGRARNAALNDTFKAAFTPAQQRLESVLAELGATKPTPFVFDGQASVPDHLLLLCPPGFEHPRSDLPPGVRFIGPLPAAAPTDADRAALPPWWGDVEAAQRVVVVTQGTFANQDASTLFGPALRALADIDALVVLTIGHDGPVPDDVPANVRVARFVPYSLLLPHTDVLVTNGGYGGVLQALTHAVPLVVAGGSEEKPEVAARVARSGAGIDLHTGRPTDEVLGEAVRAVLTDPAYARAATALQEEIAVHSPYDEVASTVEELLARRAAGR